MTATAQHTVPTADVDLFADDVLADSYPTYAALRELAPVVHLPGRDIWAVTRYDDVRDAFGDPATFSSTGVAFNATMRQLLAGTTLATDPPEHTALRATLVENLSPRAVRKMAGEIRAKAEALLADLVARGSFDGMTDLAQPFVTSIVMDLIGVADEEVRAKMLTWGAAALNMQGPDNDRMQSALPVAGEMFHWTHEVLSIDHLAAGSIGRAVFEAGERGVIPPERCGAIVHQYIAAGMDTTITALGNAIYLLGRHPEQYELLRRDPALVPSAFAEVQRYLAPIPVVARLVTRDTEIGGVTIPAGAQAALLVGAGNRDPRHYADPDVFDVTRNPTDHLSFGYGTHTCAGQGLARLEAHSLLAALVAAVGSFEIGEAVPRLHNITRPYARLEVSVRASA